MVSKLILVLIDLIANKVVVLAFLLLGIYGATATLLPSRQVYSRLRKDLHQPSIYIYEIDCLGALNNNVRKMNLVEHCHGH